MGSKLRQNQLQQHITSPHEFQFTSKLKLKKLQNCTEDLQLGAHDVPTENSCYDNVEGKTWETKAETGAWEWFCDWQGSLAITEV